MQYSLQKGELPTIVTGIRKSPEEIPIFEFELQALSQEIRDKLSKLQQIQDTIAKIKDEETRVREELNQFILEAEKEHGPLANKFVILDNKYKILADLELELMDIRNKGNIIEYERTGQAPNIEIISQETKESLRRDVEKFREDLSTVYLAAQPMHINKLMHKINAAEKLTRVVNEKYDSCLEDRQLRREILSLHHTIDLAKSKAKELRQVILEGEQENLSPRGKQRVADEGAPSQLGKTIWNDIIGGDNLEIPSTSFMKKVEQAVTKTDYKQLMKKILDSL